MSMAAPNAHQQILQMITGLWVSQIVGTLARLSIADHLASGARSADELASATKTNPMALARVLRAASAVGLLSQTGGRYGLTPLTDTLRSDLPGSMRGMAIAQTAPGHWLPWGQLTDAVRTGERQAPKALGAEIFDYYGTHPEEANAFTTAMKDMSALVAAELVRLVSIDSGTVIDVGGASGTLAVALVAAHSKLKGVVLDLPHVKAEAEAAFSAAGVADRCSFVSGDFFKSVPKGDCILLKQILHDWNDEQCVALLTACRAALPPSGRIVAVEMLIPEGAGPALPSLMDINMLVLLPGRERTRTEYETLFKAAGLKLHQVMENQSPFQLLDVRPA